MAAEPQGRGREERSAGGSDRATPVSELVVVGTAVMFLTRLPVGRYCSPDPLVLSRSTRWFPLVGLLVGTLLALVWGLVQSVAPSSVAAVATLVAGILVTGAFHEDGLADVADGAGAFGADAKLEIMRDSRVGTYGALALVLLLLARFTLLWELSVAVLATPVAALVAAHVLARWSSVWLMARIPYARAAAANRVVAEGVDRRRLLEASLVALLALAPVFVLLGPPSAVLPPLALAVTVLAGWRFRARLGGITGDCLGATNVLVELAVLSAVLVFALR